jgi:hypothetical protein
MIHDVRKSFQLPSRDPITLFMPSTSLPHIDDTADPSVPIAIASPFHNGTTGGNLQAIITASPPPNTAQASRLLEGKPPRLTLADTDRMSISNLAWGDSYDPPGVFIPSSSTGHSVATHKTGDPNMAIQLTHLAPRFTFTAPTDSYYSEQTVQSVYSQNDCSDFPVGQAVTAPGRVSPLVRTHDTSYTFPRPPTTLSFQHPHANRSSDVGRNAKSSVQDARDLPPLTAPFQAAVEGNETYSYHSDLFEYADYGGGSRHESFARARSTVEESRDWYKRSLGNEDNATIQAEPGNIRMDSSSSMSRGSKSLKEVGWDGTEALPQTFDVPRAL